MKEMNRKNNSVWKAMVAAVVALAFVLPGSAVVANVGTIGITSDIADTGAIKNVVEYIINSNDGDTRDTTIDIEVSASVNNEVARSVSGNRGVIYVGGSGPGNYTTIQAGINAATAGNTVYVHNGTYNEQVTVNKKVDLVGENRMNVIIDGGTGSGNVVSVPAAGAGASISTFTVRNRGYGFYVSGATGTLIENCNVYNHSSYGIYVYNSPYSEVTNCSIYDGSGFCSGIYLYNSRDSNIKNCNIYNQFLYGINVYNSQNSNIVNCSSHNNLGYEDYYGGWTGSGINLQTSVGSNIENCYFSDNWRGIVLDKATNSVLTNNVITGNINEFVVKGTVANDFLYNIDSSNLINGKPIWYLIGQSNTIIDETSNCGFLALISCTNITVRNIDIAGLLIADTTFSTFLNITSHDCSNGFTFYQSSNNNIINCTIFNNSGGSSEGYGIYLRNSNDNKIDGCKTYNNTNYGLYIYTGVRNEVMNCDLEGGVCNTLNSHDNTFLNCSIFNGNNGIYNDRSHYTIIMDCEIYNTVGYGIYLLQSQSCFLTGNNIYNHKTNFAVKGSAGTVSHFLHDIDSTNTLNGKPIYYIVGGNDEIYDGAVLNFGFLALISCSNVTAKNADVQGIILVNSIDSTLTNITSHGTGNGIFLAFSYRSTIEECIVYDNEWGMYIDDSSYYTHIRNCVAYNNSNHGIYNREFSHYTLIENCITYNNKNTGIYIYNSMNASVRNCSSYNNDQMGFQFYLAIYNLIVENCTAYNNKDGFKLQGAGMMGGAEENYFTDCTSYGNSQYGLFMTGSTACNLTGNTFYNNAFNFHVFGSTIQHYQHHVDPSNTIEGKSIYYITGQSDIILDETHNFGYLGLISCTNITAKNSEAQGVTIVNTTYSTILNVTSRYNEFGFVLMNAMYNDFINCKAYYNSRHGVRSNYAPYNNWINFVSDYNNGGIHFFYSDYTNVINCSTSNSGGASEDGIWFQYSNDCNVINCESYNNRDGIYFHSQSHRGNVINNSLHHNSRYGLYISATSNDKLIYHNVFVNNAQNAGDRCSNQWDNGYEGNYWDDYTGVDDDGNGIGDTPYDIPGKTTPNKDRYPLMAPIDNRVPIITNVQATPALQKYPTEPVNLTCNVIDNVAIDTVKVHIDGPEGYTLETIMNATGISYWYEATYTILGDYAYFIWANDTNGNSAISGTYSFRVTDIVLPISSVDSLTQWKKTVPFSITATADAPVAVINVTLYYRYSESSSEWTNWTIYGVDEDEPWSWSFTGVDGYYEFYSIARDETDIEDPPSVADASTGVDTVKPVTTIVLNGMMGENDWYTSSVSVTLTATDTLSGVESTWYQIDTGYWQLYSVPFTVSSEGQHTVSYYSFDQAGNMETSNTVDIKIDTVAPTTTPQFDGMIVDGVYVTDVTVTLTATDGSITTLFEQILGRLGLREDTSGVNYTMFKINDGDWVTYTESFTITEDGDYTLSYYSVDLAGNTESTKQATFTIEHDVTPPETTYEFAGTSGDNDWFISMVTVTLNSVDDAAGVDYTMYKLDEGDWTVYIGPFYVTDDAEHTLSYYSVDNVGNVEPVQTVTLKIDKTTPTIALTVEKTGLSKWVLTAEVSDETSGVAKVEFYLDEVILGEVTEAPYTWVVTKKGTAQAIVYDNAGNSKVSDSIPVSVNLEGQSTQGQSSPNGQTQTTSSALQQLLFSLH